MLKSDREQEILSVLSGVGFVSVRQLSEKLFISESSVRRALTDLEAKGFIRRSYGGAELLEHHTNVLTFGARAHQNIEAKKEIARKAATLVRDGSVLFLDQSSTSFYLAYEIMQKKDLTVISNNLEILSLLSQTDFAVYSSGGKLSEANRMCLVGSDAQQTFERINADYLFFSAKALSDDGIISDCTREEVFLRDTMMRQADYKVFLCDSHKFGTRSAYRQCALCDVDCMVSEQSADQYKALFPNLQIL